MEITTADELYENALHPYTKSLLSAIPIPDPKSSIRDKRVILKGDVGSPINPKPGCRFASRCRYAKAACRNEAPAYREVDKEHFVMCHFADELNLQPVWTG